MELPKPHNCFLIRGLFLAALLTVLPFGVSEATSPTRAKISPRQGQSISQQISDQKNCYAQVCDQLQWDPNAAYQEMVELGYARALDREQLLKDLEELALTGAIAGEIAGEISPAEDLDLEWDSEAASGAAMGAVFGLAWAQGWLDMDLLLNPSTPQAQRAINRYQRNLRKWDTKYSSCLKKKGYRVSSP